MWRRRRSRAAPLAPFAPLLPLLRPLWLLWLLVLLQSLPAASPVFCDQRNLPDSGGLEWARRTNEVEATKLGNMMRLHCCARHYDDILWFREVNGEWVRLPSDMHSSLREVVDDDRTLQSTSSQKRDNGWYRCVARNNTKGSVSNITQTFQLIVQALKPKENKVLQDVEETRTQRLGDSVKIECSIISDKPVVWFRQDKVNKTFPNFSQNDEPLVNVRVISINSRNSSSNVKGSEVRGQTIVIDDIQPANFGRYDCYWNAKKIRTVILKEGGYQIELTVSVICLVTLLILLAILGPFCWSWRVEICLFWKDRFGKLEENDDKMYDVFVSYDSEDAPFVLGTLVPVLEDHFRYRCFAWERDSIAGDWIPETLVQSVRDSRRFLMILSPAILENRWCTFALHIALKAVLQLQLHIICVKLHDVDWSQVQLADKNANETIRQVLHVVRTVVWEPSKDKSRALSNRHIAAARDKSIINFSKFIKRKSNDMPEDEIKAPGRSRFWRKLRLYLPPRRTLPLLSKPPASPTSTKSLLSLPHGSDCC